MNIKNLVTRATAGAIYIAIVVLGVLGGQYAFAVVFGLFQIIALLEYYRIVEKGNLIKINKLLNIISGVIIFSSLLFVPNYTLILISLFLLAQLSASIFSKKENSLQSAVYTLFGQLYITLPILLLTIIYTNDNLSKNIILAIFIFIWINDTAAYLVGSIFGKHKLNERISPKKTIEGFVGGIVLATSAAFLFARLMPEFPLWFWIGFGAITSVVGTMGDLFESLIKRTYAVKDSGTLIPGHGGILDRIDSFLFAVMAIYLYLFVLFTQPSLW